MPVCYFWVVEGFPLNSLALTQEIISLEYNANAGSLLLVPIKYSALLACVVQVQFPVSHFQFSVSVGCRCRYSRSKNSCLFRSKYCEFVRPFFDKLLGKEEEECRKWSQQTKPYRYTLATGRIKSFIKKTGVGTHYSAISTIFRGYCEERL